jgi:hypothetical protein
VLSLFATSAVAHSLGGGEACFGLDGPWAGWRTPVDDGGGPSVSGSGGGAAPAAAGSASPASSRGGRGAAARGGGDERGAQPTQAVPQSDLPDEVGDLPASGRPVPR